MSLVINELSFKDKLNNTYDAKEVYIDFINIVKQLHNVYGIKINNIYSSINNDFEVVKGVNIYSFLNEHIKDSEQKHVLLALLNNTTRIPTYESLLTIDGDISEAASFAYDTNNVMLSIKSRTSFTKAMVDCDDAGTIVQVRNISEETHEHVHAGYIVIRQYKPNPKHSTVGYFRDGGIYVSSMDLTDDEAQKVLNNAVIVDGILYGINNNTDVYVFKRTIGYIFHGFRLADPIDKHLMNRIKRKLEE